MHIHVTSVLRLLLGGLLLTGTAAATSACHGPVPSQRFGLKPVTSKGPYRSRLAAYKLRGESRPEPTADAATSARNPSARNTPARAAQSGRRATRDQRGRARNTRTKPTRRGSRGRVQLRGSDLEPIHRWFSAANTQFILADEVEIVVSKEFFSQVLTMNAQVGMIRKSQKNIGADEVITLRYIGKGAPTAMNSPRVFISGRVEGIAPAAGFTATARKRITIRMSKTSRPDQPVRIQIIAKGDAARGRNEEILQRDDVLGIRGALRWDTTARRWIWRCG